MQKTLFSLSNLIISNRPDLGLHFHQKNRGHRGHCGDHRAAEAAKEARVSDFDFLRLFFSRSRATHWPHKRSYPPAATSGAHDGGVDIKKT